ncbi:MULTISPECIES: ribonuclease G [Alteromonadaceae]|uniref:ribonuclease G n=1 Tax=Alteromonadaceae TaxID=72275 RepID=UPI001C09A397|nr:MULTISPECIES: ribonuclease G [Aliiglaciecola]MBU2880194.1 ribonuclease G [Aliiglaciecola lipolytica]MDO6713255.1 ribonuclease G [Aliiglaciecola sp. 2_MG-2023]MDO6754353.1 ribonuclease G [Aliiglaciecola sp. 1_MG-2023]
MSAELLINVTPSESRVALIENGILQEIHVERHTKRGLVGNIYRGKVSRVLPGMQAAFVDIGLDKAAFLHASDIAFHNEVSDEMSTTSIAKKDIRDLLRDGQDIVVQVVKDPIGTKGARLTTDITIPSRYLVFMPSVDHVGVSQRIEDEAERERLKSLVQEYCSDDGGFILRTAAEGVQEKELISDAEFLKRLWAKIQSRMKGRKGNVLYEDLPLARRVLRDFVGTQLDRIRIDSKLSFQELQHFTQEYVPELNKLLEYYQGERPIFDLYDVENEAQRSLERRVELKSGGYLIIDQTEAMTTIDINTGAFVGHRNLEETIFNTNIEATQAIARQLRLRNLGGMILIDFIDMSDEDHKRRVMHSLESATSKDRAKSNIHGFTALGLIEMTRKRTRESLEHILCGECPVCKGRGSIKTVETICFEVMREIVRVNRAYDADKFVVYASQAVAEALMGEESHMLAELEVFVSKQIKVQTELLYNQDKFDVVMM